MTPLMRDCYLALEVLHCTLGEFYQRTTPRERLLMGLYFGFKAEQAQYQDQLQRQRAEMHQALEQQYAASRQ